MSDYLFRLASRAMGLSSVLQPLVSSRFAPGPPVTPAPAPADIALEARPELHGPDARPTRSLPPSVLPASPSSPRGGVATSPVAAVRSSPGRASTRTRESAPETGSPEPRLPARSDRRPIPVSGSDGPRKPARLDPVETPAADAVKRPEKVRSKSPVLNELAEPGVLRRTTRHVAPTSVAPVAPAEPERKPASLESEQATRVGRVAVAAPNKNAGRSWPSPVPHTRARPWKHDSPRPGRAAADSGVSAGIRPGPDTARPELSVAAFQPGRSPGEAATRNVVSGPRTTPDRALPAAVEPDRDAGERPRAEMGEDGTKPPTTDRPGPLPRDRTSKMAVEPNRDVRVRPQTVYGDDGVQPPATARLGPLPARRLLVPASPPRPVLPRGEAADSGRPVVKVTIGRIEVRSTPPPAPRPEAEPAKLARPRVTLDQYLERQTRK
jgi:hypothetical protein